MCVVLVASGALLGQTARPLVLTAESLGSLRLGPEKKVSVPILQRAFPGYGVTHGIGMGDSPDFHYFVVTTARGEKLFVIKSFIEGATPGRADDRQEVSIDLLQVISREVPDSFGLRVGDRVADVIRVRGDKLVFGAGHHDVYMGGDRIFYSFATGTQSSPEGFTLSDARRGYWHIVSISWPYGAWE
jgi:hypothetical protein